MKEVKVNTSQYPDVSMSI